MARIVHPEAQESHPAPARAQQSIPLLLFGLFGAPAAWSVQLVLNYALAALACYPNDRPLPFPVAFLSWDRPALIGVNLLSLAVAAVAAWVSRGAWRRTRDEKAGSHGELMEIGEGRTRFMAACGVMTSVGFMAVILFNLVAAVGAPQCSG